MIFEIIHIVGEDLEHLLSLHEGKQALIQCKIILIALNIEKVENKR